uniref:Uncharacterized protein n=1 Tax=Anguilla anguilla TaxID=7936 RepID=A0A0E9RSQ3_ANGAN
MLHNDNDVKLLWKKIHGSGDQPRPFPRYANSEGDSGRSSGLGALRLRLHTIGNVDRADTQGLPHRVPYLYTTGH